MNEERKCVAKVNGISVKFPREEINKCKFITRIWYDHALHTITCQDCQTCRVTEKKGM